MPPADQELIALLQENDPHAYEILLENYADLVFRAAYRIVQNEEDAEDIMQETFLSVYKKIGGFRADSKLSSWLYRIASNAALDLVRAKGRKEGRDTAFDDINPESEEAFDPVDENSLLPEESLLQNESLGRVREALNEMPPKLRAAYLLYMVEGFSTPEVAENLGIKLSAAKLRIHRARKFMQEYFE
jgi:RNA polymerase sigma-70 factor (ECF subfamily)